MKLSISSGVNRGFAQGEGERRQRLVPLSLFSFSLYNMAGPGEVSPRNRGGVVLLEQVCMMY